METQGHAWTPSGSRRVDVRVPAAPRVVSGVRDALADLDLPAPLLDDARVLVSELLSNSIRHAGLGTQERVRVRAEWTGARLRVDVWDQAVASAPSRPAGAIRPDPGAESGWGLYLVDSLASRWGSAPGRYWFELELDDGAVQPS
jgi:anti-sigma regulatory factor (Ser/Thr protein kinase)